LSQEESADDDRRDCQRSADPEIAPEVDLDVFGRGALGHDQIGHLPEQREVAPQGRMTHLYGCEIEKCTFENCDFVDGMRDRHGARTQAAIPPAGADLAAENGRLRRENERLRMEREPVLKHFHGRMPMGCSCPRCNLPT
jgi:hypothetical protein